MTELDQVRIQKVPLPFGTVPKHEETCDLLGYIIRSIYLYESAFSHTKIIKSKYGASMTEDHLDVC